MNNETYLFHKEFAVANTSKRKELPLLSMKERTMCNFLLENSLRLEQERTSQVYTAEKLLEIVDRYDRLP